MWTSGEPKLPAEEDESDENLDDANASERDPMRSVGAHWVFREQANQKIGAIESDLGKFQKGMWVDEDKISESTT